MKDFSRLMSPSPNPATAQLQALDRVMAIAAFEPGGSLCYANANYLQFFGLSYEQALGRTHHSFCSPASQSNKQYNIMWNDICAGNVFSGMVERLRSDGSICWMNAIYTPIFDSQGTLDIILNIASNITEKHFREKMQLEHFYRLSLVADASDTAVIISDKDSLIVHVNRGFTRMFGWQLEEVMDEAPIGLLVPHLNQDFSADYHRALNAGESVEREEIVVGKFGQRYWAKVISNPIKDFYGRWSYTVSMLTDITSSKMHEALHHGVLEALARERPLSEVLEMVCHEVERIAPEVTVSVLAVDNQGFLHPLAGPSLPEKYSRFLEGQPIGPTAGSCGTAAWRNLPVIVDDIAHDPLWSNYKDLVLPLGFQACWSTPICNSLNKPIGTFAFYFRKPRAPSSQDFHQKLVDACTHLCALALERESDRARIHQLAFYDGLTGMPNRTLLKAKAEQAIASVARNNEQMAVLFIDLDRFKHVNDSLGHRAGDELLCITAVRLQQVLRANDIVGRLSGDEFLAVLPLCDAGHATVTIERLQVLLAEPLTISMTCLSISASIGVAMFPEDGKDLETLLKHADMAMYKAKKRGPGKFSFFSNDMNCLVQERLLMETALRKALQDKQLRLLYQPQINLATGRVYGVEALARWTHAELGDVPPSRFIPLAEECGLNAELGHWALDEACRQLASWRLDGLNVPRVSVNLSHSNFHNLELPNVIANILSRYELLPEHLTLELTESIFRDTYASTINTIQEVFRLGVRLSIDDFGTGYSSLSYLLRLPVRELKLDQSFVADLEHTEDARALSRAILGIGNSLKLTVVAEGVETIAQCEMLLDQGYPVVQGFLFSKPLNPEDLADWIANKVCQIAIPQQKPKA